jgi:hypothetical protein
MVLPGKSQEGLRASGDQGLEVGARELQDQHPCGPWPEKAQDVHSNEPCKMVVGRKGQSL